MFHEKGSVFHFLFLLLFWIVIYLKTVLFENGSGKGDRNISAALKVRKSTVASIIRKWKKFGTTRTLPRAEPSGQTERSGEKSFSQGGDQEPEVHSERAPAFLCGERRTFQKNNHLCSTTGDSVSVLEWPSQSTDLNPIEHLYRTLRGSAKKNVRNCPKTGAKY